MLGSSVPGRRSLARSWCAAVAAVLLGACAGAAPPAATVAPGQPGPPGVALPSLAPTPVPANLEPAERYAWQRSLELGEAFAAGDVEGFLAKVSNGFYRGYAKLEVSLRALLAGSRARSAVVAVREVSNEGGRVSVRARWTRSVTRPDGVVDAQAGETVFLFLKSDTSLRLLDYRGDAPFGIPGL